jgi:hypothetical protein
MCVYREHICCGSDITNRNVSHIKKLILCLFIQSIGYTPNTAKLYGLALILYESKIVSIFIFKINKFRLIIDYKIKLVVW